MEKKFDKLKVIGLMDAVINIKKNSDIIKRNGIQTHILFFDEKKFISAVSIEFGQVGVGKTPKDAFNNLEKVLEKFFDSLNESNELEILYNNELSDLWPIYMKYSKLFRAIDIFEIYGKKFELNKYTDESNETIIISKSELKNIKNNKETEGFKKGILYGFLVGNFYANSNKTKRNNKII